MIHARLDGETFGLAPAEFSAANKPVITYGLSKDKEHLKILKENALIYQNEDELLEILTSLPSILNGKTNWNSYEYFEPYNIMQIFKDVCLTEKEETLIQKLLTFLLDLPWEIKIKYDFITGLFKILFNKLFKKMTSKIIL